MAALPNIGVLEFLSVIFSFKVKLLRSRDGGTFFFLQTLLTALRSGSCAFESV